jgi:hypothetical protein
MISSDAKELTRIPSGEDSYKKAGDLVVISEGKSYSYLIHASLLTILFLILGVFFPWCMLLILPALTLILFTTGVEIDLAKGRVRKYRGWLGKHWGIWFPLAHFQKVTLEEFVVEKAKGSFFRYYRTSSRTYDILLRDKYGKDYELNDFFDYHLALKCYEALKEFGLEHQNKYAEYTAELMKNRRTRRR